MARYVPHRKKKLGTYPTINVILSTMLALFVVGLAGLLLLHAARLTRIIKENIKIQVFLHNNISENEGIRINQLLSRKNYVLKKQGCAQIVFITKEEAAQEFIQETGENFLQVLDENPLRNSYVLNIDPRYQDDHHLQKIKHEIEAINGVFEVDYLSNFIASIHSHMARVGIVLITFAIILLFVVIVLINNTIKLALYSQRFLIRSMNLVGATATFIRKPFLIRSVLIGLIAGTLANILLVSLLYYANLQLEALSKLQEPIKMLILIGLILLLGGYLSFMGTYFAINKYLRMSLDDLY